ncbi:hypothetical protein [Moorena sp. SIO1G6]|nr:hypothetical protein [Moorena sp. SIO1G6]
MSDCIKTGAAMQRGLGGPPHERLHQDGSRDNDLIVNREWVTGNS